MKPLATLFFGLALVAAAAPASAQQNGPADKPGRHAKIDTNGDGAIDRSEAAAHPKLAEHFDRLDKNKDGRIDAGERPQRHGKGGGGRRGEHMAKLDTDGDGRLSRAELAGRERLLQHFDKIDGNNDGYLTREEFRALHQNRREMPRGEKP